MASDDHDPPDDDLEGDESGGLETLDPDDVRRMFPGSHIDPITNQWILLDPKPPRPNGKSANPDVERIRERLLTKDQIQNLPPLEPLVDGLLYLPGESVLYAPPKLAKTFLALDLALSVAEGREFHGRAVRQGSVLYVVAEGVGGMGRRVEAWDLYNAGSDSPMTFLPSSVNLGDRKGMSALLEVVAEEDPLLIVFDTLARCMPGLDENSAQDVGKAIQALDGVRGTTRHVMCVHHAGKDVTRGMRGSSALLGAVDTVIELSGSSPSIRVANTAQKDSEACEPWWVAFEQVGRSVVLVPTEGTGMSTKTRDLALDALAELPASDRTSGKWLEMAEERGLSRATFFRAKREALDSGYVTADRPGRGALYTITERETADAEEETDPSLDVGD